jgi:hypothetical protein
MKKNIVVIASLFVSMLGFAGENKYCDLNHTTEVSFSVNTLEEASKIILNR